MAEHDLFFQLTNMSYEAGTKTLRAYGENKDSRMYLEIQNISTNMLLELMETYNIHVNKIFTKMLLGGQYLRLSDNTRGTPS